MKEWSLKCENLLNHILMNMQSNKDFAFIKKDIYLIQLIIQLHSAEYMNVYMHKLMNLKKLFWQKIGGIEILK